MYPWSRNASIAVFFAFMLCFGFGHENLYAENINLSVTVSLSSFQCSDGVDNDGDAKVDYPYDPGCVSASDDDEYNMPEVVEPPSGGGGGGGGGITSSNRVFFKGMAYPWSSVTLLKDGIVAGTTNSGGNGEFEISLSDLSGGTYNFGVWAFDSAGRKSAVQTFTIVVTSGVGTTISGIFISPTIATDKIEVARGDVISFMGQTAPSAAVALRINSDSDIVKRFTANPSGIWLYNFDTLEVEYGNHSARSRATLGNNITPFSSTVDFRVGDRNVLVDPSAKCSVRGDFNKDCRVNLVDFSIAAYWYKRLSPPAHIDLDGNGKIDLVDFSIMAFHWTG